eukprot:TRINITY_DN5524_c0_g1_i1.p1 TRINITY_DN5524_c0_g1~~TRINITY_DN5524_c0_g1_i1.p1  ORF type:complete len:104 (+),score=19.62 TRINITY_DN5524_c0_g1_i1:233-544(+)
MLCSGTIESRRPPADSAADPRRREFLRQWSAAKVAASAPDLEVLSEVRTDGGPPTVVVKYTDGHEAVLDVSNSDVRNIVKEVEDHALSLGNVETVKAWQLKSS